MKDKEEQITEIAEEICSHCLEMAEVCPYANTEDESGNETCFTERLHEAEKFYNAGYRKISEDSVVLSMEEYERLNECYKVRAFNKLRAENKQLKDRIAELEKENAKYNQKLTTNQWVQEIRKEALKQFAERLKEKMYENENGYIEVLSGKNAVAVDIADFENCLDETLKEFKND